VPDSVLEFTSKKYKFSLSSNTRNGVPQAETHKTPNIPRASEETPSYILYLLHPTGGTATPRT
jgi:hypothetical protein